MLNTHTVIVILEAKQGKEAELKQALINVIMPSRAEKTCLEYRLHQSAGNTAQFILYENWESKEAHEAQFNKSYILEFIKKTSDLLNGPYQVYFANEVLN